MKIRLFLLYILTFLQINHLQAQTSSTDFNLYVGQEAKIDMIDLSNENIYEVTTIEFETDDPDHAKFLYLENREIGTEIDFMVTPVQYFEGSITVKLTVWGKYQANGNIKPLRGPLIRTISCIDNPLTISPTSMTLIAGNSASITFSHEKNQYKSAAHLTYTPESGIVTVSEDGIVTAREPGTTRIMVRSNLAREERYCSVTVEPAPVPLIFLSKNSITLNLEEEQNLSYELSLPEGFPQGELTVSWQSTDEDIATVSSSGKVKAKSKGEAKIIARINGYDSADTCTVIVTANPTSITLDKNSLLMTVGDTKTLKATVLPTGAEYAAIDWASSDENVATVNDGKVKAEGKGSATITASIRGTNLKASCQVTVSAITPTSITLDITSMTLRLDEKKKLTATVMPENAEYSISWTSSDKNVATVSSDGMVTAKGYGNATITARIKDTDLKATCQVMVNPKLTLKATPPSGYVTQGTTVSLIASDDDAAIWFTTDASTPSENNGRRYDSPITINSATILQAVATHPEYFTSDVLKAIYFIREIAGDVNLDRETNVADVNTIIDVILNSSPSEQSRMLADVNNDGEVSVADINTVIEIIFNPFGPAQRDVSIAVNEEISVAILNGSGTYTCSSSNTNVTCRMENQHVIIKGIKVGQSVVTITDSKTNAKTTITVTVISISPEITVNPASLDFGTVVKDNSVTKTFTVKGTNLTGNLTVSSDNSNFTVSPTSISSSNAAYGVTVKVTYKPSAAGNHSATITVSGGGAASKTVSVSGKCENPNPTPTITVNPTSLDFGTVVKGNSVDKTFTVTGTDLTGSLTVSSNSANFTVSPGSISSSSASNGVTVKVTYKPSAAGNHSATITVSGDGAASKTVSVSGKCENPTPTPTITVNPTSLDFGTVDNGNSVTKTFTVKGTNLTGNLTVSSNNSNFMVSPTSISSSNAAYGVTVKVTYKPSAAGNHSATITVSGGGAEDKTVSVSGECVNPTPAPTISVNPTSLDFGTVDKGNSVDKSFTVTGTNLTGSLTVSSNSANFTVNPKNISSLSAANGAKVTVTYKPSAEGTHNATITVKGGGAAESKTVNVTGKCENPAPSPTITVNPTSLDFETVVGSTTIKTFTVTGTNLTDDLTLSSNISVFKVSPTTINATDAANGVIVTVTHKPNNAGTQRGAITVSGDGATNQYVSVTGRSVDPTISVTPTSVTLAKGKTQQLTATVSPSNVDCTIDWSTSNSAVATVSTNGLVTAKGKGTATITATIHNTNQSATCNVTVTIEPESATISPSAISLLNGETQQLKVNVTPSDATYTLTWTTSNSPVATVSTNGMVTAKGTGTAKITARISSTNSTLYAYCDVTVLPEIETFFVNDVSFKMVNVGGGRFTMGATTEQGTDAYDDEKPTHQVTLSSFSIGETEVTQALWQAIMGNNPSKNTGDLNLPVEQVSWNDCQEFIKRLNLATGKQFRLPTEAEWEYAARGGKKTNGYKYSGSNSIGNVAWYEGNSGSGIIPLRKTHAVAQKNANELGLYDMNGNVWEWCQDWYTQYSNSAQNDPVGPSIGSERVHRGGCIYTNAQESRVSGVRVGHTNNSNNITGNCEGLRLALDFDNSPKFRLSQTVVTLEVGKSATIDIINGNGTNSVSGLVGYVTSTISGNKLIVRGDAIGSTSVHVTNNSTGATAVLNVIVTGTSQKESYSVNGVSFTMTQVDGGMFTMGATAEQGSDAYDDEKPTHQVMLSTYSIGVTEVTQGLWKAVMGSNPSNYKGDNYPVNYVSWNKAQEFILKLNQQTGKQFRLPTEAEWEFAARGGTKSNGYKHAGSNTLDDVAWYSNNNSGTYHPVAAKTPNELGLYDMNGNVWEWCQDWYSSYSSTMQNDPQGPTTGSSKLHRGGCYKNSIKQSRVSGERGKNSPSTGVDGEGFRLALDPDDSSKFRLSKTVETVEVGKTVTVNIINDSSHYGNYTVEGGSGYVTCTAKRNVLTVKGDAVGTTSVYVTNNSDGATTVLNVIVTDSN